MRPIHVRNLILRSLGSHYIKAFRDTQKPQEEIPLLMDELVSAFKPMRHPELRYFYKRSMERRAPGLTTRIEAREKIRMKDRQKISFLCRYVLGLNKTGIPLN